MILNCPKGGDKLSAPFPYKRQAVSRKRIALLWKGYSELSNRFHRRKLSHSSSGWLRSLLNALAEESATQLSKERNPEGLVQNAVVAEEGAEVAKTAKEDLEKRLGRSVVTSEKAIDYIQSPEEQPFNKR